jgi:hypothetical protein
LVTREEPRAEPLSGPSDRNFQYFHQQLHNLKILKPSDTETDDETAAQELNRLRQEKEQRRKMKQGVYSQVRERERVNIARTIKRSNYKTIKI